MTNTTPAEKVRQERRDTAGRYTSYQAGEAPPVSFQGVFASDTSDPYGDAVAAFRDEVDLVGGDVEQHLDMAQLLASRIGQHDTLRNGFGFQLELADSTIGEEFEGGYAVIRAETGNGDPVVFASQQLFVGDLTSAMSGDEALDDIAAKLRQHRDGVVEAAERVGLHPRSRSTKLDRLYSHLDPDEAKVATSIAQQWRAETGAQFPDVEDDTFTLEVGALAARLDAPERFGLGDVIDDGYGFQMDVQHRDPWGIQSGPDRYVFKVAVDDGAGGLVYVRSSEMVSAELANDLPLKSVLPEGRVAHRLMQARKELVGTARRAGLKPWKP